MDLHIAPERGGEPDEADLRSLLEWLQHERERPWRAALVLGTAEPGEMGSTFDTLHVVGAGGVALLGHALSAWFGTRRGHLRVRVRGADGSELVLEAELKDPDAVVARLTQIGVSGDA